MLYHLKIQKPKMTTIETIVETQSIQSKTQLIQAKTIRWLIIGIFVNTIAILLLTFSDK